MPRTCTLCHNPQRDRIDRALLDGESFRNIAAQFGTSTSALQRHKAEHLPKTLVKAHAAQEVVRGDNLLAHVLSQEARLDELDEQAKAVYETAIEDKDRRTALDAIGVRGSLAHKRRSFMELRGRMTGELPGFNTPVNVQVNLVKVLSMPHFTEGATDLETLAVEVSRTKNRRSAGVGCPA